MAKVSSKSQNSLFLTSTFLAVWMLVLVSMTTGQEDTFGADPGCKDPWTTEWTRDGSDCAKVHFCVQGKRYWTIQCNDTRIWSNVGHACVEPMTQWDDCNQEMTTPAINDERCDLNPNGMNPDPTNCAQFLACNNRTVVATMTCPENTLFSTRNNTCELSFLVAEECTNRNIPSHIIVTTASPIIDKPCREPATVTWPTQHTVVASTSVTTAAL